jgi:hypothetical protein
VPVEVGAGGVRRATPSGSARPRGGSSTPGPDEADHAALQHQCRVYTAWKSTGELGPYAVAFSRSSPADLAGQSLPRRSSAQVWMAKLLRRSPAGMRTTYRMSVRVMRSSVP